MSALPPVDIFQGTEDLLTPDVHFLEEKALARLEVMSISMNTRAQVMYSSALPSARKGNMLSARS